MRHDDLLSQEEAFHGDERKIARKERKFAVSQDRSQYKKSDQDQLKKNTVTSPLQPQGRVLSIHSDAIIVSLPDGERACSLKGSLKHAATRLKNLIAVGDFVSISQDNSIVAILPRASILSRADNLSRNKEQLIAVNIDQVFITVSPCFPTLKPALIDRYIIAARKGNMEPLLVINKIDLLDAATLPLYEEIVSLYESLSIPVISISTLTTHGLAALLLAMRGKTSVFSGQSGVGKSSLINLATHTHLPTGPIVQRTEKGSHTTTTTSLIPLEGGGFCIDTPGIQSFGVWDLNPREIASYFPEIVSLSSNCRFLDCSHQTEPDCAVRGHISPLRFASYSSLLESTQTTHTLR